jgi:hypothetical protein
MPDIDIVGNDLKVNPIFVKANSAILKLHSNKFTQETTKNVKLIEDLWYETYRGKLIKSDGKYSKIYFETDRQLYMFLLRF